MPDPTDSDSLSLSPFSSPPEGIPSLGGPAKSHPAGADHSKPATLPSYEMNLGSEVSVEQRSLREND